MHIKTLSIVLKNIFLSTLLLIFTLIFFCPKLVYAKTVIKKYQNIKTDTVWTPERGPYIIEGVNNILSGVNLTIQPGTIIKFYELASINVDGELSVVGSAEEPVIFTSIYDAAAGGDSSPGSSKIPVPGIWGDIGVRGNGRLSIDNAIFKYGGTDPGWQNGLRSGVIFVWDSGTVNITNSVFTQNIRALYNFWGWNSVVINNSKIFDNLLGGVKSVTMHQNVDVKNNWWGDPSGPYEKFFNPSGKGDSVFSNYKDRVKFDPWIGKATNKSPILSYSQEEKYMAGENTGVFPNRGDAGLTDFAFKVVYADEDNDAPKNVSLVIQGEHASSSHLMNIDNAAGTDAVLNDGNYVNGEQFFVSMKLPQGKYKYYFTSADEKHDVRWPPTGELNFEAGYSNVVFLPGLEASRLYRQGAWFENQLWEPNRNSDVEKLFLDADGESLDQDIYTRDVIDEVNVTSLGQVNIYKNFLESLDGMVSGRTINAYKAMPYDWRMSIDEIVNGNIKTENGSYSIIGELESLAEASQTGKVTIVAHSMGGLVAKRLIQRLTELGKEDLVGKLILVAVPQTGTPSSVAGLLHGDGQDLAGGLLLNRATARGLGENMKSAYALLPSSNYFIDAEKSIIVFEAMPVTSFDELINIYGTEINSLDILSDFLLGLDGRIKPASHDTDSINILSSSLLDGSIGLHNSIDSWIPPEGLEVYQIAGWGLDTIAGIRYKEKQEIECPEYATDVRYCMKRNYFDREPIFSVNGDGTVMVSSALAMKGVQTYYLDLRSSNIGPRVNREHKNITEVDSMQILINNLIKNKPSIIPNYMHTSDEILNRENLRVSVHSPVLLDIFESTGQHVGKVKNLNPDSDLEMIENQIPNSYYMEFGEGKYAGIGGIDGFEMYDLKLSGLDYGTFTLDITEVDPEGEKTVSYKNIPVTPSTIAKLSVENLSKISALEIDMDGDGVAELNIGTSEDSIDPVEYVKMIRQYILNINSEQHPRRELLNKLDALIKFIDKKEVKSNDKKNHNEKKIEELISSTEKHILVISDTWLDRKQVKILLNMLNNLRVLFAE